MSDDPKKLLTFVGIDSWSRPVYKSEDGRLFKDVLQCRVGKPGGLCDATNNEFEGEPDCPIPYDFEIFDPDGAYLKSQQIRSDVWCNDRARRMRAAEVIDSITDDLECPFREDAIGLYQELSDATLDRLNIPSVLRDTLADDFAIRKACGIPAATVGDPAGELLSAIDLAKLDLKDRLEPPDPSTVLKLDLGITEWQQLSSLGYSPSVPFSDNLLQRYPKLNDAVCFLAVDLNPARNGLVRLDLLRDWAREYAMGFNGEFVLDDVADNAGVLAFDDIDKAIDCMLSLDPEYCQGEWADDGWAGITEDTLPVGQRGLHPAQQISTPSLSAQASQAKSATQEHVEQNTGRVTPQKEAR